MIRSGSDEPTHRDCAIEPMTFSNTNEATAVLNWHDDHGNCLPWLAATAFISAPLQDY